MNKQNTTPPYFITAKIFFIIMLIFIIYKAAGNIISAIYCSTVPLDSFVFTDTGSHIYIDGPIGYINAPFSAFGFSSSVKITDARLFWISCCLADFIANSIPLLLLLNMGRKLLNIFKYSYTPFTCDVTKILKKTAKIMLFLGIFSPIIFQSIMNIVNLRQFNLVNPWELSWLFTSAITFLLSGIFARGCQLQEEADATL